MAAANILNKQSRTADKGWSSGLGVGRGVNNSLPYKIYHVTKYCKKPRNQNRRIIQKWIFERLDGGRGGGTDWIDLAQDK